MLDIIITGRPARVVPSTNRRGGPLYLPLLKLKKEVRKK
jgi:hypothetical protein